MLTRSAETYMAFDRNQALPGFRIVKWLVLFLATLYVAPLSAQTLEILLMDGQNGRPMVGKASYVNVWVGSERKAAIAIPTNGSGVARLQLTLNSNETNISNSLQNGSIVVEHPVLNYSDTLQINAPYVLCGSKRSDYSWLSLVSLSTNEILQHGYVSPNTCGKVTVPSHPGQVTLFVRQLTWWEKLKQ